MAMAAEVSTPAPGGAVVTSNRASVISRAAVAVAVRQYLASPRRSRIPVDSRPAASMASRPTQAARQ